MLWGSKKVLGLDIGTSTIKMAEVEVSRSGATLNNFVMIATPPQAVSGGDILDPGAVAQTVAALHQELRTKRKSVAVGLWGSMVMAKKITMARIDEKMVADQVRFEAEQYFPWPLEECSIGHKVLKGLPQSTETMDILIVVANNQHASKYVEIVQSAGLQCSILDVGGFALANSFELNYGVLNGQAVALLNVGASVTNLVVIENGEIIFCRDLPVGGLSYTVEIQKALSISIEEAESHKLSACTGQAAPEEIPNILRATNEIFGDEIKGVFEFFMNTNSDTSIKRCFLTGGGSRVPGLIDYLGQALKIPCESLDPLMNVKPNGKNLSPSYLAEVKDFMAVAIGLGLRKQGD